jgi:hypothetical protein
MEKFILRPVCKSVFDTLICSWKQSAIYRCCGDIMLVVVRLPERSRIENFTRITADDIKFIYPHEPRERDHLFVEALLTSKKLMPARLFDNEHIENMDMLTSGGFADVDTVEMKEKFTFAKGASRSGLRLTTSCWCRGAVSVFYPDILERILLILDSEFFVTFPSVNEARVHSVRDATSHEVRSAIVRWNRIHKKSTPGEYLTDSVYRYCANRHELQEVEYADW